MLVPPTPDEPRMTAPRQENTGARARPSAADQNLYRLTCSGLVEGEGASGRRRGQVYRSLPRLGHGDRKAVYYWEGMLNDVVLRYGMHQRRLVGEDEDAEGMRV